MAQATVKGKIWKTGASLVLTIPAAIAKYAPFIEGDDVEVEIKTIEEDKPKKRS